MSKRKAREEGGEVKLKDDDKINKIGEEEEMEKISNDENIEKTLTPATRKRKKQSPVWDYFKEGISEAGKPVAECMFCDGVFTMMHGTSTLARHAKKHGMGDHKGALNANDPDAAKAGGVAICTPKGDRKAAPVACKSDEEITEALVSWMADSQVPCEAVENRKFQKLFNMMAPRYTIPSSKYVKSKLIEKREVFLRRAENITDKVATEI